MAIDARLGDGRERSQKRQPGKASGRCLRSRMSHALPAQALERRSRQTGPGSNRVPSPYMPRIGGRAPTARVAKGRAPHDTTERYLPWIAFCTFAATSGGIVGIL
jgi:hypothetical protein